MNTLVSVIIPVYNASKYLERCLDSVLNQTFKDYEIILIDDGSMDGSGRICDEYAQLNKQIRIIHKANEGVSKARKIGVELAKGVYSIHVDADDYIDSRELESLYSEAINRNADIVICDYYLECKPCEFCLSKQNPQSNNSKEYLEMIFEGRRMGTLWNKLIKTSLYEDVVYPLNINYCEDVCVLMQILSKNVTLAYVPQPFYYYCFNAQSITRVIHESKIDDRLNFIAYAQKEMERINVQYDMTFFKVGAKLAMLKSGLYSYKKYSLQFEGDELSTSLCIRSRKNYVYMKLSQFILGYYFLKSLFFVRNKFLLV